MKTRLSLALPSLLLLAACANGAGDTSVGEMLKNPLYAEHYYDARTDHMVNLVLQNDPLAKDAVSKEVVEKFRAEALRQATKANQEQARGAGGAILSDFSYARGEALLLDNTLYIGPTFDIVPGPDIRVYVSTMLDPREGTFPDESAVALGVLKTAYGAHSYALPDVDPPRTDLRSVVFYDQRFKRIYGFAQLQSR